MSYRKLTTGSDQLTTFLLLPWLWSVWLVGHDVVCLVSLEILCASFNIVGFSHPWHMWDEETCLSPLLLSSEDFACLYKHGDGLSQHGWFWGLNIRISKKNVIFHISCQTFAVWISVITACALDEFCSGLLSNTYLLFLFLIITGLLQKKSTDNTASESALAFY